MTKRASTSWSTVVEIAEGRPVSKTKSWYVTRLVEKATTGLTSQRGSASTPAAAGREPVLGRGRFAATRSCNIEGESDAEGGEKSCLGQVCRSSSKSKATVAQSGPNTFDIEKDTAGKTIAQLRCPRVHGPVLGQARARLCREKAGALQAAGVDEIWCVSVNVPS
jgi:hypothetical protein